MLLIREIMYCKPGKVRPLVEKFTAMSGVLEARGWKKIRVMTDLSAERFWTLVAEIEAESLEQFLEVDKDEEMAKQFGEIMKGYHDLVESGRREIYNLEN